ncbi:MAG: hypothetical protein IJX49_05030 [Clostridia bacterium]|nr:hypothetical protein [Clostridia bacterium]
MQTLLQSTQAYKIVKTESRENKLSHAYLLLFDDGRNLRFTLRQFAKILFQCDGDFYSAENENKQRIAKLIDSESYADCLFLPAEGKKLTVEDAEKILEESTLCPIEGDLKVFVVGDFSEANIQTQNKLLKLLEEPPKGVVFLLGATSSFAVLTTVLSRTKKLEILSFPLDDVTDCLQRTYGDKYDRATLAMCAATSGGNVGSAQGLLEGGHFKVLLDSAYALALTSMDRLPALVKQIGETKQQKELLSTLRLIFRDGLLLKIQGKRAERNLLLKAEKERSIAVSNTYTERALLYAQEVFSDAEKQVKFNATFPQCIELCMAKIQKENK